MLNSITYRVFMKGEAIDGPQIRFENATGRTAAATTGGARPSLKIILIEARSFEDRLWGLVVRVSGYRS
jgi:hypothetical protein